MGVVSSFCFLFPVCVSFAPFYGQEVDPCRPPECLVMWERPPNSPHSPQSLPRTQEVAGWASQSQTRSDFPLVLPLFSHTIGQTQSDSKETVSEGRTMELQAMFCWCWTLNLEEWIGAWVHGVWALFYNCGWEWLKCFIYIFIHRKSFFFFKKSKYKIGFYMFCVIYQGFIFSLYHILMSI